MATLTSQHRLCIRADSSETIGAGHVMRCLALAEAWKQRGGEFDFISRTMGASLVGRIVDSGGRVCWLDGVADPRDTASVAAHAGASIVVIDGYHFTVDHDRACRAAGLMTLVIDDNAEHKRFESDFVLNQNIHATAELYSNRADDCTLLLGLPFVLLRSEFRVVGRKSIVDRAHRVLLSFGASDVAGLSLKVLRALAERSQQDKRYRVVVGSLHPLRAAVEAVASRCSNVEVLFDVRAMAEQMSWADLAVLAAGSTVWEAAACSLPSLVVVAAPNQEPLARHAAARGVVSLLGFADSITGAAIVDAVDELALRRDQRLLLSAIGHELVDGLGADRVVDHIIERGVARS